MGWLSKGKTARASLDAQRAQRASLSRVPGSDFRINVDNKEAPLNANATNDDAEVPTPRSTGTDGPATEMSLPSTELTPRTDGPATEMSLPSTDLTPRSDHATDASTILTDLTPRSDAPTNVSIPATSVYSVGPVKASSAHRRSGKYVAPTKVTKAAQVKRRQSRAPEALARSGPVHKSKQQTIDKLLKNNTQELMSDLTPEVQKAFETLFDRLDMTDSGGITAKEIQNVIKRHTDKSLTLKQVHQVLQDLDVKETGDVEFDEFIFMLSQPDNYIRLLDKQDLRDLATKTGKNFRQKGAPKGDPTEVFFEALRNATRQDSMTALRTFYRNRLKKLNDHVIHDWSAGQRCIGLSDQEMLKRYETIQGELLRQRVNFCKDNSYKQSPYARPLEWGVVNLRDSILDRRRQRHTDAELAKEKKDSHRVKISEFVVTPKAVPLPRYVIHPRSPLKRTFDYDQLAGIRQKVDDIALKYYTELKDVARESSTIVKKELAVNEIANNRSRENFTHTFTAYCAPFVVSPWIPMPSPTLQASFAPLGKSKYSAQK